MIYAYTPEMFVEQFEFAFTCPINAQYSKFWLRQFSAGPDQCLDIQDNLALSLQLVLRTLLV